MTTTIQQEIENLSKNPIYIYIDLPTYDQEKHVNVGFTHEFNINGIEFEIKGHVYFEFEKYDEVYGRECKFLKFEIEKIMVFDECSSYYVPESYFAQVEKALEIKS